MPNIKENILSDFLKFTLTKCMETLDAESGSIFLFDQTRDELVLRVARNGKHTPKEGLRLSLGEGICGIVASRREPVWVEDINSDPRFHSKRRFNHYQTASFLSAPLEFAGELIGVINITERHSSSPFNAQDLKFLIDLCSFFAFFVHQFRKHTPDDSLVSNFSLPGRLAAGLIHELNNPLDGTIRYLNLSLSCLGEESIIKEYLLEAKKGLNRITKIIRSLLDFGRTPTPSLGTIDISKTLDEALFLMNHYFVSGRITITKRLEQDLPRVQDHGLKLVFTNILKNACDAIGSKEGNIGVMTEKRDGFIDVHISDTGPGITKEAKAKIFEPFFTTKEMGRGSGLGLAICSNIIERYKGCILVESQEDKGTTFTVRIPTG
ncbi:MAG: GAF domain-containing sensor histidine kinase [Candidatus Omnitrophota bacterium]